MVNKKLNGYIVWTPVGVVSLHLQQQWSFEQQKVQVTPCCGWTPVSVTEHLFIVNSFDRKNKPIQPQFYYLCCVNICQHAKDVIL